MQICIILEDIMVHSDFCTYELKLDLTVVNSSLNITVIGFLIIEGEYNSSVLSGGKSGIYTISNKN